MVGAHERWVAHADMDAFYAAIEQLDDPTLRGRPVLVGGTRQRGVVMSASYEARAFGVTSAMPMAAAVRRCPDAVCTVPRFDRYMELSREVMDVFGHFSPVVEAISLDEAFIEMTGAAGLFGAPDAIGRQIKEAVREATGLTVSVGLSGTKYVAKVASDYDKPDGLCVVPQARARQWLAPLPVERLWGVGPKTAARMHAIELRTIGQLAAADTHWLRGHLGSLGPHFQRLALAVDPRPVVGRRGARSVGSERTLARDIRDVEDIKRALRRSADDIARRLRKKRLRTLGVRVKLKTSRFVRVSRQARLPSPTNLGDRLYQAGCSLLDRFEDLRTTSYRLVGMAAYDLVPDLPVQVDLLDGSERQLRLEGTIDALKRRFGPDAIRRAEDLEHPRGLKMSPNMDELRGS